MSIDRKTIESSLRKKGFIEEGGDHKYFYHEVNGKRTGSYTFTSRGSGYKTYGDTLLKRMRFQWRLDSLTQVKRLLECPMDMDEYNSILREKGIFKIFSSKLAPTKCIIAANLPNFHPVVFPPCNVKQEFKR